MINLTRVGQLFFSIGIIAYGTQQIVIRDFRPQILPDFPAWVHEYSIFPIVTGIIMIVAGLIVAGLFRVNAEYRKRICLCLGFYFFALIIASHIPYLLWVYPHRLSHLGSWGNLLKGLAFSGSAFVIARSFTEQSVVSIKRSSFDSLTEVFATIGRIFFCTTIILFGCNHFVYDISFMVPAWFGVPAFWSYFGGAALILSGTAILLKILLQPVALLLAIMLFIWFVVLHIPNAIANPSGGNGNAIVSAFDALLFCGTALVLSESNKKQKNI